MSGAQSAPAGDRTFVSWRRPLGSLSPPQSAAAQPQAFALRQRAAVFGHNAPASPVLLLASLAPDTAESPLAPFVEHPSTMAIAAAPASSAIDLDAVYSTITSGSFVVLATGAFNYPSEPAPPGTYVELYLVTTVTEISRQDFGLSAKVTRLGLDGANFDQFATAIRETSVFAHSDQLPFATYPIDEAIAGNTIPVTASADGLSPGRRLLVSGVRQRDGAAIVHAAALVAAHRVDDGRCRLEIDPPLPDALVRSSVVVHANVAAASHGESVTQILGAGNAAVPFQRFELKQLPLTFRAAATELGAASELTVRVDDIAWKVRDTLFGAGPRDRAFTLASDEQGRTFVQFGDGARGARLSSGVINVRAEYRKGLGAAGNVAAESLTQLTTRPLGLKGVSNPRPAEGGTDPEDADQARDSIPQTTRTLGRAVSVLDYEDFARAYSGVAKARAAVLQLHTGPTVVITIAGPGGTAISTDSPIWINLRAALAASGDPHVAVRLLSYLPSPFHIGVKVKCDPDFDTPHVLAAVEAALRAHFSFDARDLGQPVQQSDVIAVAQGVPGVLAVDLDLLYGGTQPDSQTHSSRQTRLLASRMTVVGGEPAPDELLTLDPGALDRLEEMP
jgi:predicted phage baseplate assembly protein